VEFRSSQVDRRGQGRFGYVSRRCFFESRAHVLGKGRLAYLVAFSSLLPLIPASLCLSDLDRVSKLPSSSASPAYVQLLPLLLRSLSLPHPAQRANTILALSSVLETVNHTASVDNLLHANALAIVEGVLRSAIRNKESPAETSGVSSFLGLRFVVLTVPGCTSRRSPLLGHCTGCSPV
jgi:hypothetical protein